MAKLRSPELKSLCVFCGTRDGADAGHRELAHAAGRLIAEAGIRFIYGGGDQGLSGIAARAARDAGGAVTGVIPEFLIPIEGALEGIALRKVATLGARKAMIIDESDAFLVLPGGTGTLEEVFDVLKRRGLGLESKPVAFVDQAFWAPFKTLLDHVCEAGFTDKALVDGFSFEPDIATALETLSARLIRQPAH